MKLTKNLNKEEFDCNDGSEMPEEVLENIKKLAVQLQIVRDFFNSPIKINSGYRSKEYNKKIGGATNSQHILGTAADFTVKGYTPDQVANTIESLHRIGAIKIGGLGRYDTFTHTDIRNGNARWDNRTK